MNDNNEYESATDKLNAMMDGTFDFEDEQSDDPEVTPEPEVEPEPVEEELMEEPEHDEIPADDVDNEDPDPADVDPDEVPSDTDTTTPTDGEELDTDNLDPDAVPDEPVENAPVDDGKEETPSSDDETKTPDDGEGDKDAPIDYQKQYEELLAQSEVARTFYDKATSEFVANGKKVKGYTDPDKVIKSQQMAYGLNHKMAVLKEHKQFFKGLQENGMVDDPTKFDMAMNIMKGDPEAIKQHMANLNMDPSMLDMHEVKYEGEVHRASNLELAFDDVVENAARVGVQDRLQTVLSSEWDNDSVVKLLERPGDSSLLVEHLQSGIYDAVNERILEKTGVDVDGSFSAKSSFDKYTEAAAELENEYQAILRQEQEQAQSAKNAEQERLAQETIKTREVEAEAAKVKARLKSEEATRVARNKATSMSKPKPTRTAPKPKKDKMSLTGADFQDYFNREILGK